MGNPTVPSDPDEKPARNGRPPNPEPSRRFAVTFGPEDDALLAQLVERTGFTEAAVLRLGLRVLSGQPYAQALIDCRLPRFTKEPK